MAGLKPFEESSPAYRGMVSALWPRGPIWDQAQPGVGGLTDGLALEATRFHNRLVALMREAFPATADELLAEWEEVFGLPLCTAPTTDDGRRLALAGRVAARGGQSRAYYIDLAWRVLEADGELVRADDPEGVWIEERPFGAPFVAWGSNAWEFGSPTGSVFYWILHLPAGASEEKTQIIECLLCRFKPAHTVLVRDDASYVCETPGEPEAPTSTLGFYYHFPGSGTDDVALADIGAIEHQTIMFWMRVTGADEGGNLLEVQNDYGETYEVYLAAGADFILELTVDNASFAGTSGASPVIAFGAWDFYSVEITPGLGSEGGGVGRMYRNAVEILETTGTPFEGGASPGGFGGSIKFQGINLNVADVANIKTMNRVLTSVERTSLHAAGPQHDYRASTGDWVGDTGGIYWRDADVAGTVENIGTAGTADLVLAGDTTSEAF